ncbi:hypothetical protein MHH33_17680 [Paenisporosarcina sp. FSL H8-0542]|uniref:hypothetical protein n=1 Tax=Paenisporosarcina sp. FSL H8-0542 TaxID=2921401 RepID=UPI003159A466
MLKSIGILLIAVTILWIEVPPLLEKKYKKELLVFAILLAIAVGISITLGVGKSIPTPLDLLTFVFKPLNDVIAHLLK